MDIQTMALYGGGLLLALILLKFIIRIPMLLLKYAILAAVLYGVYLLFAGRM